MIALDEAEAQVRAARHTCSLASVETLERARAVIYRIGVARDTRRGYAQAIADASHVIAALAAEHREGARTMRMTQAEMAWGRE